MLKHRPPKPYKLLKFFVSFVTTVKSRHSATIWKKLRWKSRTFTHFKCITEIIKKFKSLYGFGGRCLNIREVCMDFEPCFKVHNLVSVYPKGIKLGQMTNLNVIFHVVVSVYQLVTIWNSPQLFDTAFHIQFQNNFSKVRQTKWRYSIARFDIGKKVATCMQRKGLYVLLAKITFS